VHRTYRSLDAGGWRFFLLDTIDVVGGELEYEGRVSAAQLEWLRSELERTDPEMPLAVATHMPLMTGFYQATKGSTAAAPPNRVVANSLELLGLLENHNLRLVLQGHLHVNETLLWQGVRFITGGALCGAWWGGSWHGTGAGFGVLTLRHDRIDWEYRDHGWKVDRS
jgi:3',5'-cyclic AMP phosphodiesterase CpdA